MTQFQPPWFRGGRGRARLAALILLLGLFGSPQRGLAAGHVVLVVIDGPRHTEFLDEPGTPNARVLATVLAPRGARATAFRNCDRTVTMCGHGALLTGDPQPIANNGSEHPTRPTLFERLRKARGLQGGAVWMVGGKDKLRSLCFSTDPGFGEAYQAASDDTLRADTLTYAAAIRALTRTPRPVFTCINFASVDMAGHSGDWARYLRALAGADSLVGALWIAIQSDSILAGDTDLFVTADHGRHDDAHGGFSNHGDDCPGCRALPFVAIGPDIRAGTVSDRPHCQEDVAVTVAYILGLGRIPAEGRIMDEVLVDPPAGGN